MDTHNIHDEKVGFHSNTEEARSFLEHGVHGEAFRDYLKTAQAEGKAHFTVPGGQKFTIEHEVGEDGKSNFSVRKHY